MFKTLGTNVRRVAIMSLLASPLLFAGCDELTSGIAGRFADGISGITDGMTANLMLGGGYSGGTVGGYAGSYDGGCASGASGIGGGCEPDAVDPLNIWPDGVWDSWGQDKLPYCDDWIGAP